MKYRGTAEDSLAVRNVSLSVSEGETLGLVGESGSGKTSLGKALAGLLNPFAGELSVDGSRIPWKLVDRPRSVRTAIQYVFQNPALALNPRMSVRRTLSLTLRSTSACGRAEASARVEELLELVYLPKSLLDKRPGALSGGEQQRVAIARALAGKPRIVICDEIVSALDVSVQAGILELLERLKLDIDIGFIFISHDLAVVRTVADRTAVMRDGEIVELDATGDVFQRPKSEYTRSLLAAAPTLSPDRGELNERSGTVAQQS
jgi:peptide/nickel transport system ATP-binding protein